MHVTNMYVPGDYFSKENVIRSIYFQEKMPSHTYFTMIIPITS